MLILVGEEEGGVRGEGGGAINLSMYAYPILSYREFLCTIKFCNLTFLTLL